jgi:hypothetical protein
MQRAKRTINQVLNLERSGGKLLQRDDYTLILSDCEFVPYSSIQLIADQYPHLQISVNHTDHSSSGFIVVFALTPHLNVFKTSACMQLFLILTATVVVCTIPMFDCWTNMF